MHTIVSVLKLNTIEGATRTIKSVSLAFFFFLAIIFPFMFM